MDRMQPDVIVIGAGAAGMAAAAELAQAGRRITVLEARNRCGGRIDTRHEGGWPLPVERGPEFIHGRPSETWDILQAAGLAAVDVAMRQFTYSDGRLVERDDRWEAVQSIL